MQFDTNINPSVPLDDLKVLLVEDNLVNALVAGAILIETVFSWPGIGFAAYQAVIQRDYPMLQGTFLVLTVSVIFFNLLADLLYAWLDPRISE